MIVCIDSGNTRLKWAAHDGAAWLSASAAAQADHAALAALPATLPPPTVVAIANVAGPAAAAAIETALAPWRERFVWVNSSAEAGGVRNGYANPARLGVDRWCALVGARSLVSGSCLVVGAGTATTVDTLAADGCFQGGFILPGFDLMRAALARNTAGLPLAEGAYTTLPTATEDAIFSGCLEAQLGAVERAFQRLAQAGPATCLLFGGAAPLLGLHLAIPHRRVDNLVLEGLRAIALAQGEPK